VRSRQDIYHGVVGSYCDNIIADMYTSLSGSEASLYLRLVAFSSLNSKLESDQEEEDDSSLIEMFTANGAFRG